MIEKKILMMTFFFSKEKKNSRLMKEYFRSTLIYAKKKVGRDVQPFFNRLFSSEFAEEKNDVGRYG